MKIVEAMKLVLEGYSRFIGWMTAGISIAVGIGLAAWPVFYRPEWTNSQILRNMWPYHLVTVAVGCFGVWLYSRNS